MKFTLMRRGHMVQILVGCIGLVLLIVFATGCSTVKVEPIDTKIMLIVKQPDPDNPSNPKPEGALIGFVKLKNGDKLLVINRFGGEVEVEFPPGIIEAPAKFFIEKNERKWITITSTTTVEQVININLRGPGHGGADMIIEPPGGGG